MRAFVIVLIVAAIGVGGYLFYRNSAPTEPAPALFETPAPTPMRTAGDCAAEKARYVLRGDPRLHLRFEANGPVTPPVQMPNGLEMPVVNPPLIFVARISTKAEEHRFLAAPAPRGAYERNLLAPLIDGEPRQLRTGPVQVSLFDSEFDYVAGLPQPGSAAPAHIFAPDLTRYIFDLGGDRRVDAPIGFFDFAGCDDEAAPAAQ
jgi:hypothetical protein